MADDRPYWESARGDIVKWQDIEGVWHDGPIRNDDEALETEHYVLKMSSPEGDRFYTVHYPPTDDFDLDWEIDRIETEYGEEI